MPATTLPEFEAAAKARGFDEPNVAHAERYGSAGATYWVARRNAGA